MDRRKREAIEAAGFRVGDAADFLGLDDAERQLVEFRLAAGRAVRAARGRGRLTQRQLAARIGSSQPRVAQIEAAAADVSLDLMLRALFASGGGLADLAAVGPPTPTRPRRPPER